MSSGISLLGIENYEVPLVQFLFQIKGGMLLENASKIGVSNMLASLMTKGTKTKTPEQLENAIESLGATIRAYATDEGIFISGNSLAKNYKATIALVEEIILQPRWDLKEFDLIKQSTLSQIQQQKADPNSIARNEFKKLIYGKESILSYNRTGDENSVKNITINDLKKYYSLNFSPSVSIFQIVGAVSKNEVTTSLSTLNKNWIAKKVSIPAIKVNSTVATSKIYFYDVPGAKQSVIRIGYPALAATDADYYPAMMMNYRLGGGGFASQLTQQLRE